MINIMKKVSLVYIIISLLELLLLLVKKEFILISYLSVLARYFVYMLITTGIVFLYERHKARKSKTK